MLRFIASLIAGLLLTTGVALAQPAPGPGPVSSPWVVNGAQIYYNGGCALVPLSATGGCQGSGSMNVQNLYAAGVKVTGINYGSNVATALAQPLNGTGALVATNSATINNATISSPNISNANLNTPSYLNLINATNLPISAIASLGTGIPAALAANENGSGALVGSSAPSIANLTVTGSLTATGLIANSALVNSSTTVNGQSCTLGSTCSITAAATSIAIGTTTIITGTSKGLLYDNAGAVGNLATANSGVAVTDGSGNPSISTTLPSGLAMGTPSSIDLTHATNLPISAIQSLGTGVPTALTANVTGTGGIALSNGPTLTSPVFSSISNGGTISVPSGTDTLVARATTDTLTNKTLSGSNNTLSNIGNASLVNSSVTIGSTSVSLGGTAATVAGLTLTSPTFSSGMTGSGVVSINVSIATFTTDTAGFSLRNTSKTASQIYSPQVPAGYYYADVTRSVLDFESGSTVTNGNAYGAYVYQAVAQGSGATSKNAVGYFGVGVVAIDSGAIWGVNYALNDNTSNGLATLSGRKLIGGEFDFQVNGASIIEGMSMRIQGAGTPSSANAFQVSQTSGATAKWTYAYISDDGAASTGLNIGALASSGTSISGQPNYFSYFNSSGTEYNIKVQSVLAAVNFTSSEFTDGIAIGTANSNPFISIAGSSTNANLNLYAKGTGQIIAKTDILVQGNVLSSGILKVGAYGSDTNSGYSIEAFPTTASSASAPAFNFNDQATAGFSFSDTLTHFAMTVAGNSPSTGTGSYEGFLVYQYCVNRDATAYCTGGQEQAIAIAGSTNRGNYTGNNPYVKIPTGMTGLNSVVGEETDVENHSSVVAKEGIRIADLGGDADACTGDICAIIDAVRQSSAAGFKYGLRFNGDTDGDDTTFPIQAGGTFWKATTTSRQLYAGIDWGHLLGGFSSGAAFILPNNTFIAAENTGATAIFQLIGSNANVVCLACSGQTVDVGTVSSPSILQMQNNTLISAVNSTNTGTVGLIKADASNNVVIGSSGTSLVSIPVSIQVTAGISAAPATGAATIAAVSTNSTAYISVQSLNAQQSGFIFYGTSAATEFGLVRNSATDFSIYDYNQSASVFDDSAGNVTIGIVGKKITANAVIELPNNASLESLNAAGNADVPLVFLGGDNNEYIGYGGTQVLFGGNVTTGSVLSVYGTWASQPSDVIFGDTTNGTDVIIYRPTGSRDLRIDTATSGDIVKFSQAGLLQLYKYGAGTLTTDASGNVTASSDARLKDVTGLYTRGIADLAAMDSAVMYRWKTEVANGVDAQYAGWTAQGVAKGIPEAVGTGPDGYLTLAERPILAATVNGLLDLDARERALQAANDNLRAEFDAYRAAHP